MNCPFYGHAMYQTGLGIASPRPFLLLKTNGNQCALLVTRFAPCLMETNHETPDWKTCPLVREMRMEREE